MKHWLVIASFLIIILFISGCVSEQEATNQKQQQQIVSEFNKHVDTHNDDTLEMNGIMGKYNLKSISLEERINIVNEYIRFYNVRINHLNDFYNFVTYNEPALKDSGVDTYYWKKGIKDTLAISKNNIYSMKGDIETTIQYEDELRREKNRQQMTQQQYDEYSELLKLLGTILI